MVALASLVPKTEGDKLLDGLPGVVPVRVGATGAVESFTYIKATLEQLETLPAGSAAFG